MYQPQSGVVQSISLQHRPKGPDDGCINSQVFASQKPKLKNGKEAIFEQRKG
jgi:hypothetical protein